MRVRSAFKKEYLMQVRKRDDTLEAFMPEKVVVSIVKSGAPYEDARSIARSLSDRPDKILETVAIRDFVHSQLKSRGHESSIDSWITYEMESKGDRASASARRSPEQMKHMSH
jgi:hypothetical protein